LKTSYLKEMSLNNYLYLVRGLDLIIGDFGLATDALVKPFLFNRCGTPGFVAPEVLNIIDQRTTYKSICDLYSTGIIFHILYLKIKNILD
jgi:serine/threonine protein kinase